MHKEHMVKLILLFEKIREHPAMFIGRYDYILLTTYLHGFYNSSEIFGLAPDQKILKQISLERGWKWDIAHGPVTAMLEKGTTQEELINEILTLHIMMWQRILALTEIEDKN